MTINIFDEVKEKNYVSLKNVGDSVQGTYIARNDSTIDSYGHAQTLVDLLTDEGQVKTFSIRHNKIGLLAILDQVNLGQIIGFKFVGTKENPGKNPTKMIKIFQDPNIVNDKWLAERAEKGNVTSDMTPDDLFPATETPATPIVNAGISVAAPQNEENLEAMLDTEIVTEETMTNPEKIKKIAEIATSKLGATNPTEIKEKIAEKTGLTFLPMNLDAILEKLKNL